MSTIQGKSFVAHLYSISEAAEGPIGLSSELALTNSGWLTRQNPGATPVPLKFDYIEHTEDRVHYSVSVADEAPEYAGTVLGISRNGYLGVYGVASVIDFWKVEVVRSWTEGEYLYFNWRDHQGHRVSLHREYENSGSGRGPAIPTSRFTDYLSVAPTSAYVLRFKAKILKWL